MEIGVVVHGPGIVDSGWAEKIIDILSNFGNVSCRLGGTMGRTAVIDAGLEDVIDISLKLLPSQSLELFNRERADVIFLLNYGKSPETGRVFGYKVFTHYFKQISNEDFLATNHKPLYESSIPVIQIERPGEEDGAIISWNVILNEQLAKSRKSKRARLGLGDKNMLESLSFNFEELFGGLKAALDLIEVTPEEVVSDYFSNNQESEDEKSIEKLLQSYDDYETSNYTYRKIHGVSPDENIFINGIVVGYSNADSIVLIARDGMIVDIINGTIKYHGLEKLGPVDLERIIVKTGLLRKSEDINPRILSNNDIYVNDTERNLYSGEISEDEYSFKVAYVDHAAYDIYKFKDFDLVVTIGDDTSLVASDILYRFNIPIIGIIDGDLDKVVENGFVNEKSIFLEVASGFDDIVGQYINEEIFMSKDTFEMPFDEEDNSVEEFKAVIFNVFKDHLVEKVKDIVPSFVEKDCDYNVIDTYQEVVDENPELVENLDEFIDGFEYETLEEGEEIYLDENYDSPLEEYADDDFEELSDAQLEELLVEHGSGEYEEVYFDEEIYLDDEVYPDEEDSIYYDEVPLEETADEPLVEEIYVEHGNDEHFVEEIYVEHDKGEPLVEEVYVERDSDEPMVEEIFVEHDDEEVIYEDVPVEEVYLDENLNDVSSEESIGEYADESDGWAEYIEEEFGDSVDDSQESDDSDRQN
ncbi:DUF2117 domain-containing protein [Methanobrevibacter ruminantium]|uniref:DUF2117 domain-containing protein n=1 Tax=Methanobrevibacter ruminantium TaxID=83816 RepID=UPI003F0CDE34